MHELNDILERCSETLEESYRIESWLENILSLTKKGLISGFQLPPCPISQVQSASRGRRERQGQTTQK
jgi:hypothetical protein